MAEAELERAVEKLLAVVSLPVDPDTLNRVIMAMGFHGYAMYPTARGCFLCPAGRRTSVRFNMLPGWSCVTTNIHISANYYDPSILVHLIADGYEVTLFGVPLVEPTVISYGDHFIKKEYVEIVVENYSDRDVVVCETCYGVMLKRDFLEKVYIPLVRGQWSVIEKLLPRR